MKKLKTIGRYSDSRCRWTCRTTTVEDAWLVDQHKTGLPLGPVVGGQITSLSYASNFFADHLWPLHFPLVSKYSEKSVSDENRQTETPHKRDGVEEVGIARTGIDPEVMKGRSEEC